MARFTTPPEGESGAASSASGAWSRRHLETLFENAGNLLLELSTEGHVLYASPLSAKLLGENECKAGINFFQRLDGADVPLFTEASRVSNRSVRCGVRLAEGEVRWYEFTSDLVSPGVAPKRWLVIGRDVTEQKEAQAEIEKLRAEIHHLKPKQELGRLAGRVAHDFNNILGAILAYTDLTRREIRPHDPVQDYLRQVMIAGDRAKNLVRQVLTFSRRQIQKRQPVHLLPLVEEVLQLFKPTLPGSIEVKLKVDTVSDIVVGDPIQIHEAISNLITNAAHAMETTGGEITVRLAPAPNGPRLPTSEMLAAEKVGIELSVRDTGQGVDKETQRLLFQPFFTTRASRGGTGLGLTVVQAIMADHGGAVTVQSEPGNGATFVLTFPPAHG